MTVLYLFPVLQLSERGQARLDQIEDAAGRVQEFYRQVAELQGLLGKAEEGLNAQGLVGSEVEMIKQQLQEFKVGITFCWLLTWMWCVWMSVLKLDVKRQCNVLWIVGESDLQLFLIFVIPSFFLFHLVWFRVFFGTYCSTYLWVSTQCICHWLRQLWYLLDCVGKTWDNPTEFRVKRLHLFVLTYFFSPVETNLHS